MNTDIKELIETLSWLDFQFLKTYSIIEVSRVEEDLFVLSGSYGSVSLDVLERMEKDIVESPETFEMLLIGSDVDKSKPMTLWISVTLQDIPGEDPVAHYGTYPEYGLLKIVEDKEEEH